MGTLKAAFKAFSFNKLSDFFIFLMLILGVMLANSFDIVTLLDIVSLTSQQRYVNLINSALINLFVIALLGAAFIKSAQIGPHI